MSPGQKSRSEYLERTAKLIAGEAAESHLKGHHDRVIRKTHESLELLLKSRLLQKGIEPAKTHDLLSLAKVLGAPLPVTEQELSFLTEARIPSFYGADDFIPDQHYQTVDSQKALNILRAFGLLP